MNEKTIKLPESGKTVKIKKLLGREYFEASKKARTMLPTGEMSIDPYDQQQEVVRACIIDTDEFKKADFDELLVADTLTLIREVDIFISPPDVKKKLLEQSLQDTKTSGTQK